MRIAFDGTTLRAPWTGVAVYAEHLLRHLAQARGDRELVVFSNGPIAARQPLPEGVDVIARWPMTVRQAWLQAVAPRVLRALSPDLVHFTTPIAPLVGGRHRTVLTVHDMTMTLMPEVHPPARRWVARRIADRAIRAADALIAVSAQTRDDVLRLFDISPARVHVVHEAAGPEFRPIDDQAPLLAIRRRFRLWDRVILCVGSVEPRKNLVRLVQAFARLRGAGASDYQLVIAGPPGWRSAEIVQHIEAARLGDAVRLSGYVPPADLPALYNAAELVVCPSLCEGFGLTVLEAMACGRPVVASGTSAIGEVAGDAAQRVDPLSVASIAEGLARVARDEGLRRELSIRAQARARAFSWHEAASRTLAIYDEVLGR